MCILTETCLDSKHILTYILCYCLKMLTSHGPATTIVHFACCSLAISVLICVYQLLKPSSFWLRSALLASMPSSSLAVLFSYSTNLLPAQAPPPIAIRCSQGCLIRGTFRRALLYMLIPRPMHPPKNAPDTISALRSDWNAARA